VGAPTERCCGVRRIVSDTGPLLHLYEAACLALLEHAGTVTVPKAVESEMGQHVREWPTRKPPWITVTAVIAPYDVQATGWQQSGLLEMGEAEAIALALQLRATWLLTDDTAARVFATALGFEVHGSLGIVLWSAACGHLSREESAAALDRLAHSSLWISARVLAEARAALARLFP
jgi:predicted nucleic acid-binding protein